MEQIITHFTDNDMYTFTCQYYILHTYPKAEVRYSFFDRNNTKYPKGFDKLLQEQINGMANITITEKEISFMKEKIYFLPEWYYNFLRGFRLNPKEVHIFQDPNGYLSVTIEGKWYSAIIWEMPILSTVSELMHIINGDTEKVNWEAEWNKAYDKCYKCLENGIRISDMGTRRRFSFHNQEIVIDAFKQARHVFKTTATNNAETGDFIGTSNVWFAKEFNLTPIGTMSHQIISAEECVTGVFECNYNVMDKWSMCYNGDVGIYLYDTFGDNIFLDNLSKRLAKTFDGLRVDSGDEKEQTEKIINKYQSLGIDPRTKAIVYSNALDIDKAIELHKWVNGRMKDSYGIGTHLMADVTNTETGINFAYSNIVVKLVGFRITEARKWQDCIKLSNDKGKMLGSREKCDYISGLIKKL